MAPQKKAGTWERGHMVVWGCGGTFEDMWVGGMWIGANPGGRGGDLRKVGVG